MTNQRPLDAIATSVANKAQSRGFVTVLVDPAGRVHAVPAAVEVVGVYGPGVRKTHILDDLIFVGARR